MPNGTSTASTRGSGAPVTGDRKVESPTGECPLKKCAITVYVEELPRSGRQAEPSPNVYIEVSGSSDKKTDRSGLAEFKDLDPAKSPFIVKASLGMLSLDYALVGASTQTKDVP